MIVIYRMCDIPSTNAPPFEQDKLKLNTACLRSFVGAFIDVRPFVYFLCDHCPGNYKEMIDSSCPFKKKIVFSQSGINATMLASYAIAADHDDYVLFQECDYLYRPRTGDLFLESLSRFSIVSPYDHLNFYIDRNIHSRNCDVDLVGDHHFRTVERNTMTWGTHTNLVKENMDILNKYGYLDDKVWGDLLIAGHRLWTPIPSIATHMVKDYLSPGINWERIYGYYA